MVKKRQISGRNKNRLYHKNSTIQKENPLRFNAILMSAIAVFVILFIYFLFFQSYFDLNQNKITSYSITGKLIQPTEIVLNLTFNDGLPAGSGVVSGATLTADGKSGSAYSFDGIDDYINLTGYTQPTNEITISAWVYPKPKSGWETIYLSGFNETNKQGIAFEIESQTLSFWVGNGAASSTIRSDSPLTLNSWHHIVAVKNLSKIYIFVDNVKQQQILPLAGPISYSSAITRLGNNALAFNGTIDEVKIFSRALTDAEVIDEYNSYNPPATPPNFFCKDSDVNAFGGQNNFMNYYIKGFVNSSLNNITYIISEDSCTADNKSVIEFFCNVSGLGQSKNYICPTRCENGACTGVEVCRDSDGMNYSTQGSIDYFIDGINLTYYDYCSPEDGRLVEFFCSGNKSNYSFSYCPVNYSCFEGRCNNTAVTRGVITPPPAPVCINGNFTCQGTSYVLCQNGQWLPGVLLLGQCGYNPGGEPNIIDQPVTGEVNPPEKPSSIWIILLVILIIAVVIAVAVILFIFIKKKQEFNNKTRTSTSPQLIKPSPPSSPPYSKTPSVQSPKPASILPPPSTTTQTTQTTTTTSISSASNLKKRQM